MQKVNRIRGGPTCVHESLMNDIHELVVYILLKRECMACLYFAAASMYEVFTMRNACVMIIQMC